MTRHSTVVFVTTVLPPARTGPATFAGYIYEYFQSSPSVDFHLVAPSCRDEPSSTAAFYRRLSDRAVLLAESLPSRTIIHANNTFPFARVAQRWPKTIVQVNDYDAANLWTTLRRKVRAGDPRACAAMLVRRRRERQCLMSSHLAICNSEVTRTRITEAYGLSPDASRTIEKAVDVEAFGRPPGQTPFVSWPCGEGPARVLFIGSDWDRKGLDTLVAAVALLKRLGTPCQLAIAGAPAPRVDAKYRARVARQGLADCVTFLGAVAHTSLPSWLWSADAVALPSREEAFGVVAIEAMAAGVPLVASAVGGLEHLVDDRVGTLVPPSDPLALANGLRRVLSREVSLSMRREGPKRAARFSAATMLRRYEALYGELSERG